METGWLPRMQACRLYAYQLPAAVFRPQEVGGLPTSRWKRSSRCSLTIL